MKSFPPPARLALAAVVLTAALIGPTSGTAVADDPPTAVLVSNAGLFVPLLPVRIVDTRMDLGAVGPIGSQQTVDVQVTGQGGIPSDGVAAVVANVTVTDPRGPGNLALYPSGLTSPAVSNLNFVVGQTVANLVTVPVGAGGMVAITNNGLGSVEVILDVAGFYLAGTPTEAGAFASLAPTRIVDTRSGLGSVGPIGPQQGVALQVTGRGGVPGNGVSALVANVTVVAPTDFGDLAVFPTGTDQPTVSNLNFVAGQTVPNLVTVPVGADGKVVFRNDSLGSTHLVVDVAGYYLAGTPVATGAFVPLAPSRLVDSRSALGTSGPIPANQSRTIGIIGRGQLPMSGIAAVVANITVTEPVAPGDLRVYPSGFGIPTVSTLNFAAGQTVPNLTIAALFTDGNMVVRNDSAGTVQLVVDVSGYFIL